MNSAATRYLELDALRGFAVMGILAINIAAFAQPEMAFVNPVASSHTSDSDIASWAASFILFDGKMRGLFSLLFGASTALVIERATVSGQSAATVHFSRMFWLALFGLGHFYLVWFGDILFLYAGAGCALFLFRNWSAERLIKWGLIGYILGALLLIAGMATMIHAQWLAGLPGASGAAVEEVQKILDELGGTQDDVIRETAVLRGSYAQILQDKLDSNRFMPLQNLILAPIETLPLMMLGMGLYKNGFLTGKASRETYVRIGTKATGVGLLFFLAFTAIAYAKEFDMIWMMNMTQAWSMLPRLPMIIGYAALLVLLIQRFPGHPIIHRVAAAGRAAFSNYLGTSIVMTFIFYGWGLGYFEKFGRFELQFFVLAAWAAMLLWSKPWLLRYRYGPLEWLWRSLARFQHQPMRISAKEH